MTGAGWAFLKALFTLIPILVLAVRDGQIRDGTLKEINDAVLKASKARADRAIAARDGPDDGMSDGYDRSEH